MNTVNQVIEQKVAKTTDANALNLVNQIIRGITKALNTLEDDTINSEEYNRAISTLNTLTRTFDDFFRNYPLDDTLRRMTSGNRLEEAQSVSIENHNIQQLYDSNWLTQEEAMKMLKGNN